MKNNIIKFGFLILIFMPVFQQAMDGLFRANIQDRRGFIDKLNRDRAFLKKAGLGLGTLGSFVCISGAFAKIATHDYRWAVAGGIIGVGALIGAEVLLVNKMLSIPEIDSWVVLKNHWKLGKGQISEANIDSTRNEYALLTGIHKDYSKQMHKGFESGWYLGAGLAAVAAGTIKGGMYLCDKVYG